MIRSNQQPTLRPWDQMPNLKIAGVTIENGYDYSKKMYWIEFVGGTFFERAVVYPRFEAWLEQSKISPHYFETELKYYFENAAEVSMILLAWSH